MLLTPGACLLPAAESESPAQAAVTPAGASTHSLSVTAPIKRAAWQERLTLGPGDVLNLQLFDMPDSARTEVPIGPDGRISFLQARDIMATGLTIDELRAKMDEALSKFYQNPRTIITPVAFHSKKYFVLGAVVNKGVYTFDRPLSVIEAIARAGGLETGLYAARTVELADLQRSFLVRNGQRVPVDFERLFQRGDLSQNIPLQPDDYLYFALASANEIYVLGEVMSPGVQVFAAKPSAISRHYLRRWIHLPGVQEPRSGGARLAGASGNLRRGCGGHSGGQGAGLQTAARRHCLRGQEPLGGGCRSG